MNLLNPRHLSYRVLCKLGRPYMLPGRKVDFFVAGTQKGGTTALDNYLRQNPAICMAEQKEVHFFDNESIFQRPPIYQQYHKNFRPTMTAKRIGETTPIYSYWRTSSKRIFDYNPDAMIIIVLRNPIERAHSHWNMEYSRGTDELSFSEAIRTERDRCVTVAPLQHRIFSYVDRGYYARQLHRIWRYFPMHQTLILKSEDLRNRPQHVLDRVFTFLGVPTVELVHEVESNRGNYQSLISVEDWAYLSSEFEPSIRELEKLMNWDLKEWLIYKQ